MQLRPRLRTLRLQLPPGAERARDLPQPCCQRAVVPQWSAIRATAFWADVGCAVGLGHSLGAPQVLLFSVVCLPLGTVPSLHPAARARAHV